MTPFVTFVVPVYNAEKTLRKCLDSLVCQTQQNIEVLLVNDGSSDSSESIAKEYTERYPQLFSLINKENGGVSSARNLGIEMAKGEYLGFIDSVDYVDPDFAELMYKKAKETDADIVVCPVSYEIGDTVKRRYYNKSRFGRTVREDPYILFRSNAYSVNKIIRRSYFLEHGFRYENHMFEDSGLLYNVMLLANRIECVNIPFYHYITVNFHHIPSGEPFKIYYDLDALKKEIKSFRAQTAKRANAGEISYTDKYSGMLKYMLKRGGECNAQAGVFAVLLNHVGVECGVCHGRYLNRNGTAPNHYWNYAVVDGRTYYYDVDVELQNYGKGQGDYYWYKKTRAEAEETHAF